MTDTLNPLRNCDGVDSESQLIKLELLNFWLQITKTSKSDYWRGRATAFFWVDPVCDGKQTDSPQPP
jgi:hypothetical protein